MKVCFAALIPLLACLLVLPSDVNGRRRIRQKEQETEKEKNEYEVSHIKKRELKFVDFFKPDNLAKACDLCEKMYSMDKDNCVKAKKGEKLKCFQKAKGNKAAFTSAWKESFGGGAPAASSEGSRGGGEAPAASSGGSRGGGEAPAASSGGSPGGGEAPAASSGGSPGGGEPPAASSDSSSGGAGIYAGGALKAYKELVAAGLLEGVSPGPIDMKNPFGFSWVTSMDKAGRRKKKVVK